MQEGPKKVARRDDFRASDDPFLHAESKDENEKKVKRAYV